MEKVIIMQFFTLGIFVLFMGFCFCDGFKLHILRKLIWFFVFILISVYTIKTKNEFDLTIILPIPLLLAMFLGWYENKQRQRKR